MLDILFSNRTLISMGRVGNFSTILRIVSGILGPAMLMRKLIVISRTYLFVAIYILILSDIY